MTGYGRATQTSPIGHMTVEIQSLNRRHLDMRLMLPGYLTFLQPAIRNQISEYVQRGAVTVNVQVSYLQGPPLRLIPNQPVLESVAEVASTLAKILGISREVATGLITHHRDTSLIHEELIDAEGHKTLAEETVLAALKMLMQSKQAEGNAITIDLMVRLDLLNQHQDAISHRLPEAVEAYRTRLRTQLVSLSSREELSELVLSLDKGDVTEELTRIAHHIEAFKAAIQSEGHVPGKSLDFRLQELMREFNTIGSKSQDIAITESVIAAKTELEKMREQIQNVE